MDERRRFHIRPPDNWADLTQEEQEAWSRSVVERILSPDEPPAEEIEPIEATIYLGQQRPTEPYKRSPYAQALQRQREEHLAIDARQEAPDEEGVSQITFIPRMPQAWKEALEQRAAERALEAERAEAEAEASSGCEVVYGEDGSEAFLCRGPSRESESDGQDE